ncbi:class I SAM-dependent methyltransferase [Clostridioides sp. ZZV15-6598]|uniref:class I SAM-dependent methyltransferase n=1 Tax=Clostridioides sp. ZZV15-6598 TaxID=2811501 RepID=UPI001D12369E|nr:class I SAM-dependent methyltransferase [Clostridioides sp. ZZV15-6598]
MKKFTEYIGSQFGNPRGIIGKCCCLIMNTINQKMYKSLISCIRLNEQSRLLDIGYGNGYLIQQIYKKYSTDICGIDISKDMKELATKQNLKGIEDGKIQLSIGNCCNLEYKDNSFDIVTSINTIYFWDDTTKGLSEIFRVLKPEGIFYNVVYSKEWLQKLSYTKEFQLFDKENLILLGEKVGFSEITIEDIVNGKSYLVQYRKNDFTE